MARTIAVGIGIMEYPFDTTDGFWRWVDLCEQGGIDSIWQTDRMISRSPILECMTALAAIAGRTRRIKFGVNVVSVAMRDPVLLAKQCATIDVLSGGLKFSSQMFEVIEIERNEPGREVFNAADNLTLFSSPYDRLSLAIGPYRDNSR